MTKLRTAVIAGGALLLAGFTSVASAAHRSAVTGGTARVVAHTAPHVAFSSTAARSNLGRSHVAIGVSQHVRRAAPFVGNAPQLAASHFPAAAFNRHGERNLEHFRSRRFVGGYPYFYRYGYGLGAPYFTGTYVSATGAYDVCYPLLRKYRETGADRWHRRYEQCLAGDYNELNYL